MGLLWDLIQEHIDTSPYPPSIRQIAERLGVSHTAVRYLRTPKQLPSRDLLEAIANLVGVRYSVVLDAALRDTGYHEEVRRLSVAPRPLSEVEEELQVAVRDLDEFRALKVTGSSAQSKRHALQSRVDALNAELVASRSATTGAESVADS